MNIKRYALKTFMFIFLASVMMIVPAKAIQFSDLAPNHWGYEKVMEFAERGVLSGYEDNTFRPDNTVTRAEFVHVVNNYFGYSGNEEKVAGFSDLDQNEWYIKGINEAVARGYVVGYEDGTFRPSDSLTRQEAIVVLAKILNIADEEIPDSDKDYLKKYIDYEDIADWAEKSVYNYAIRDFISGYEDGTLRPTHYITRTELVYLLNSVEQKIVIEEKPSKGGGGSGGGSSSRVIYYTITINSTENGSVVADTTKVEKGKDAKITITPDAGYELENILDNGVSVIDKVINGVYTISNVQANHTISATFSLIPAQEEPVVEYTITVNSNEKGTAVADATKVEAGKTVNITLTPGEAYKLYALTDNNEDVLDKVVSGVYTISNVQEDHTIDATFGCNCEVYVNKLIEVLKKIADMHVDLLVEKLEACKSDAEAIRAEIEAVLGEKIENSEYKEEIEAVIEELQAVDYKGLSVKAIAVLGKIVTSETFENALEKLGSLVSEEDKAKVEELLNEIEAKINAEVDNIEIKIEDFIENHDCVKVQDFIKKLINKLESIDSMEELIDEVKKYIQANVAEEDIEKAIEALKEKYNASVEELKIMLEENKEEMIQEITDKIAELKEKQEAIENAIEELKTEIKENLPTEEELKAMAEELLAKGEATLEDVKEKLEDEIQEREEEIQQGLEDAKEQWESFLEEVKDTIVENMPSNEEIDELLDLIETAIPEIEELTGVDVSGIAEELGINKETVSDVIEAISGNEELQAILKETIKDKVTDVISNALSNNETVEQVLDKIYEETNTDVVDLILLLAEEDTTGIAVKVVLSNTELSEVLDAIDADITEEDLTTVVTACIDYYGLSEFVKTVDGEDNAKELLTIAIENANITDLMAAVQDATTREIILDNFTISELATILGPRGEDVINSLLGIAKVSYDKNAEKATGETAGSTHNKYLAVSLTANGFTRDGYTFKGWATTANGSVVYTDKQSVKSTDLDSSNVTLYAVWEANTYTITSYSSNGNSVTAKAEAKTDEVVTITVVEANEYQEFKEAKINGKTIEGNSFVMPACNVIITATFNDNTPTAHTITTISADETKGTITSDLLATTVGNVVTITIEAEEGYKLSSIIANNGTVSLTKVSDTEYTFTMPDEEVTVQAVFEAIEYTITVKKIGEGTVDVATTATVGQQITITTTPGTGYELKTLTSDEVTITDSKFTMGTTNVTIEVEFGLKDYKVTINKLTDNGDVTVNLAQEITDANMGDTILVTVITDTGYDAKITFDKAVTIKDSSSDANGVITSFTMPSDNVVVTVEFIQVPTYSVTGSASNGKIYFTTSLLDATENSLSGIKEDEEVTITIVPDSGYKITSVTATDSEGDVSVTESTLGYKFTMRTSNVTVEVDFEKVAFAITVVDADGGTVEIEQKAYGIYYPVTQAKEGETVYIKASKEGYTLIGVTVDGAANVEKDLINGMASFTMLDGPVEISVEFEEVLVTYTVTVDSDNITNGIITVKNATGEYANELTGVKAGETIYVSAIGGVYLDGWTPKQYSLKTLVRVDSDGNETTITGDEFIMPEYDITIKATFGK